MLKPRFIPIWIAIVLISNGVTYGQVWEDFWEEVRGVGVHGGVSLDPELIYIGGYAQVGPVFRNLWVRPSVEYAFGEITDLVSLNPEAIYYFGGRTSDWNVYGGAGLAFILSRRAFEDENDEIDFTDWDADTGLNLILGAARPNGFLIEMKAGTYGAPGVKLLIGYTF